MFKKTKEFVKTHETIIKTTAVDVGIGVVVAGIAYGVSHISVNGYVHKVKGYIGEETYKELEHLSKDSGVIIMGTDKASWLKAKELLTKIKA